METSENVIDIKAILQSDIKKIIEQIEKTSQPIPVARGNKPNCKEYSPQRKCDCQKS